MSRSYMSTLYLRWDVLMTNPLRLKSLWCLPASPLSTSMEKYQKTRQNERLQGFQYDCFLRRVSPIWRKFSRKGNTVYDSQVLPTARRDGTTLLCTRPLIRPLELHAKTTTEGFHGTAMDEVCCHGQSSVPDFERDATACCQHCLERHGDILTG